jgi:Rieske Fe-S protein
MPEHEQERFEDYLEVEQYLEDLRAERKGVMPEDLTAEQAQVYHMAALLRSAVPENAEPRAEFLEELQRTLQKKVRKQEESLEVKVVRPSDERVRNKRGAQVSRRHLLTGGAVAAASLALGTVAGVGYEKSKVGETKVAESKAGGSVPVSVDTGWKQPLIGEGVATIWQKVVGLAELGTEAYAFQAEAVVGYVMKSDEQDAESDGAVIAFSAACTHMGCLVQWQGKERSFNCPCHGGKFDEYGQPAKKSAIQYLRALPRINTKVGEDGYVYVEVPAKNA